MRKEVGEGECASRSSRSSQRNFLKEQKGHPMAFTIPVLAFYMVPIVAPVILASNCNCWFFYLFIYFFRSLLVTTRKLRTVAKLCSLTMLHHKYDEKHFVPYIEYVVTLEGKGIWVALADLSINYLVSPLPSCYWNFMNICYRFSAEMIFCSKFQGFLVNHLMLW